MDIHYLKTLLRYDAGTGVFTWLVSRGRMTAPGVVAGTVTEKGGIRIGIDGKYYHAHRLAWFYVHGVWPTDQIDHADLDKANNRISNLREASNGENGANKRRYRNNKCGFKGVAYRPLLNMWVAAIKHGGKTTYLGCFDAPEDAHAAYVAKAVELHGEFARAA